MAGEGVGNDHVGVQKRAFQESREVELITRQARGEVDVRYVGR